jgi:hypothetical protein
MAGWLLLVVLYVHQAMCNVVGLRVLIIKEQRAVSFASDEGPFDTMQQRQLCWLFQLQLVHMLMALVRVCSILVQRRVALRQCGC